MNQTDIVNQTTSTLLDMSPISNYLDVWSEKLLVEMTFLLVIVTAIMAIFLWKAFTSQILLNSGNLSQKHYEDFYNEHRMTWNMVADNEKRRRSKQNNMPLETYNDVKLRGFLNQLEIVSFLVKTNAIRIDFAYNIFSPLFLSCLDDPQICKYMDAPYTNIKIISKWIWLYENKTMRFKICRRLHLLRLISIQKQDLDQL